MADNKPVSEWTDAEVARWMAERDGWRVEKDGNRWLLYEPESEYWIFCTDTEDRIAEWLLDRFYTRYPKSLDAAVGWLGRRGLEWERVHRFVPKGEPHVLVFFGKSKMEQPCICDESPTCSTVRALCNAGVEAMIKEEVGDGTTV